MTTSGTGHQVYLAPLGPLTYMGFGVSGQCTNVCLGIIKNLSTVEPHLRIRAQLSGCSDYMDPQKHQVNDIRDILMMFMKFLLRASIENVLLHLYGCFSYTD